MSKKSKSKKQTLRTYSCKLANSIVDRITDTDTTGKELDLLKYLALIQDAKGNCYGVHYQDSCNTLDMCEQSFYNSLRGLEKKGIITRISERWGYWDLRINDNVFETPSDDSKGYININREVLFCDDFLKLKANAKKLVLKLIKYCRTDKVYPIYAKKIADWLGIKSTSMAIIYRYLEDINFVFMSIRKDPEKPNMGDLILITPNMHILNESYLNKSEFEHHYTHKLQHFLRANKLLDVYSDKIHEIVNLLNQYKSKGMEIVNATLTKLLKDKAYSLTLVRHYLTIPYWKWAWTFL